MKMGVKMSLALLLIGNLLLALCFVSQGLAFWNESGGPG